MKRSLLPHPHNHITTPQKRCSLDHNGFELTTELPSELALTDAELALVEGFMQDVITQMMALDI